ncbi:MAG: SH3 domain-containing protein [Planctomycetales bacterium]|nr:SH3 domain-containing protein [Planctomycetales bacterium]
MSLASLLVWMTAVGATPVMPYPTTVAENDAIIRSGPGEVYYVTQYLPRGADVEVHLRQENGWLAIRPPRGSFSWIPAAHVQSTGEPAVAAVQAENAVSFIGTLLGTPQQYQWQVRLEPGELVQIVGQVQRQSADGPRTWLKIAPPSGEFRWIHESQVIGPNGEPPIAKPVRSPTNLANQSDDAEPSLDQSNTVRTNDSLRERASQTSANASREPAVAMQSAELALQKVNELLAKAETLIEKAESLNESEPKPARTSARSRVGSTEPRVIITDEAAKQLEIELTSAEAAVSNKSEAIAEPAVSKVEPTVVRDERVASASHWTATRRKTASPEPPVAAAESSGFVLRETRNEAPAATSLASQSPSSVSSVAITPLNGELEQLSNELTQLAASDPRDWKLGPLRDDATRLIDSGKNAFERGQARLLLEKINEFDVLQQRYLQLSQDSAESEVAVSLGIDDELASNYDGIGILMPVHSTRAGAPPFALLDGTGNVVSFVMPSPGLNLNRYVKKEVGLIGPRRQLETLRAELLTAERVVELDRHRR